MNPDLADALFESVERLDAMRGRAIRIEEIISRSASRSTNRHVSTRSVTILTLERASVAFSGCKLMILGKDPVGYEVCFDLVCEVGNEEAQLAYVEQFTAEIYRLTTIKEIDNEPDAADKRQI